LSALSADGSLQTLADNFLWHLWPCGQVTDWKKVVMG